LSYGFFLGNHVNFLAGWQPLKLGAGGFLTGFSQANDGTMLVRTDAYGAYIWNTAATTPAGNAGGTGAWQQLVTASRMPPLFTAKAMDFGAGVYEIQLAPSNSSVLYMMHLVPVGSFPPLMGMYKSVDMGMTWTQLTNFANISAYSPNGLAAGDGSRFWGQKIAVHPTDPNTVLVGTPHSGLFYSTDGGTGFTNIASFPVGVLNTSPNQNCYSGVTGICFQPGTPNTIYAAAYGQGIFKSTTGVTGTWTQINSGLGPSNIRQAKLSSNGTYFVLDEAQNVWTYSGTTWTEVISDGLTTGLGVDPATPAHILAIQDKGQLNESTNSGATWGGWSVAPGPLVSATDIPYLGIFYANSIGVFFDRSNSNKIYTNGNRGFSTVTLTGAVTPSTSLTWHDQSVGIEELVCNDVLVPPGGAPIALTWDSPAIYKSSLDTYPSTFGPVYDGAVCAGWSADYALATPTFIVLLADGSYAGGPQRCAKSTDGGQNWTLLTAQFGYGNVAVSSTTSWLMATTRTQPKLTTNGGTSFAPINLETLGIPNPNTITSGSYNSTTGVVTLNLGTAVAFAAGAIFNAPGLTGTGNLGSLQGDFTTVSVATSTQITYQAATGLGSITITGGSISGWGISANSKAFGADFGAPKSGSHYLLADKGTAGRFAIWFGGIGFFVSTDNGSTWSKNAFTSPYNDNPQIKAVPGQTGHFFISLGRTGVSGSQPGFNAVPLQYTQDFGATRSPVNNMPYTYSVGYGATAPGQSYPAVYTVGWQSTTSNASTTITASGTVAAPASISFTAPSGLGLLVGTPIKIDDGGSRSLTGLITSYNNSTGALVFNSYEFTGSGSNTTTWNVYLYGIWRCITGPATPSMTWTQLGSWPLGSMDTICNINGDPSVYGRVYVSFDGSGAGYGNFA
jgi:hypothetical protein